ncbi:MAG: hypothetical protein KI786_05350 [Mameliella sp.]|nr:hypothetical protein [Phaeodactylibacter sp.]
MYTKKNRLFSNLSRLGIVQGLDRVEIARITILNRLNLTGAAAAALVGIKDIVIKGLELTILLPIFLFFVTELFLSHFRFHTFARYTTNILLPLLLTTVLLLYGPESGTGYTLFVFITTAIIFHKDWTTRIALITFIIILYSGSSIALLYFDPPFAHKNDPFDNIITFLGTSVAVSLMITYFFHENQKYETEQSQLLDSLKSSNTALKSANTELERFAYITSHDLRSPVRNISSFLGLAERDLKRGNYEHLEEYFAFAKDGAKQMNALIEDILEFTRLNQEYEPDLSLTDLSGLIAQCEEQLRATYGTAFQICAQNLPEIYTSPNLLSLLCMNLLDNAIKYNESEQPV